jgi:integrase/recombinase XerD
VAGFEDEKVSKRKIEQVEEEQIMLTTYRRHRKACKHRDKGRAFRHCHCPIWVDGFLGDEEIRESLKMRDWQRAQEVIRDWEADGKAPEKAEKEEPTTITKAQEMYLADAAARGLKKKTIDRHRIIFRQLDAFAAAKGIRYLNELNTEQLTEFRAAWKGNSTLAGVKKLERLKSFFRFCVEHQWLEVNPAATIRSPKVAMNPTLPFTEGEMTTIRTAALKRVHSVREDGRNRARQAHALILFLRYTGLRISDAVSCPVDRLQDGKLWLYTQKTGQHVYCPLPDFVIKELESTPKVSDKFWFWTGNGSVETARKKWSESLAAVFKVADIKGHAHQFRDTFAVELLKAEVPIERVSILLGHASVRVTEKHYNPWNRARQVQAEADVQRAWKRDPMFLFEEEGYTAGTRQ